MSATIVNPSVAPNIPNIQLPINATPIPAGATLIWLLPRISGTGQLTTIMDHAMQLDVCCDDYATIIAGLSTGGGGIWANNVNATATGLYTSPGIFTAIRVTNSDTSAHNVAVRV